MSDKGILKVEGISCDNPDCEYAITSLKLSMYVKWLNKPCPNCGQILLTEEDYNLFKLLSATTSIANKLDAADPRKTAKVYQPAVKE